MCRVCQKALPWAPAFLSVFLVVKREPLEATEGRKQDIFPRAVASDRGGTSHLKRQSPVRLLRSCELAERALRRLTCGPEEGERDTYVKQGLCAGGGLGAGKVSGLQAVPYERAQSVVPEKERSLRSLSQSNPASLCCPCWWTTVPDRACWPVL